MTRRDAGLAQVDDSLYAQTLERVLTVCPGHAVNLAAPEEAAPGGPATVVGTVAAEVAEVEAAFERDVPLWCV